MAKLNFYLTAIEKKSKHFPFFCANCLFQFEFIPFPLMQNYVYLIIYCFELHMLLVQRVHIFSCTLFRVHINKTVSDFFFLPFRNNSVICIFFSNECVFKFEYFSFSLNIFAILQIKCGNWKIQPRGEPIRAQMQIN